MRPDFFRFILFLILGVHAAAVESAGLPRYDHYNPAVLNEYALHEAREGDTGTALILLERALQLAPHDARIRKNYNVLRAWRNGQPVPLQSPQSVSIPDVDATMPPFSLWPKK